MPCKNFFGKEWEDLLREIVLPSGEANTVILKAIFHFSWKGTDKNRTFSIGKFHNILLGTL